MRDFQPTVAWSLLNDQAAADVAQPAGTGLVIITGLPAFKLTELVSYTSEAAVTEVAQIARVLRSTDLVAGTRYTIKLGNSSTNEMQWSGALKPTSYVTPATLGTQATEKHNMYVDLARKINLDPRNFVTAYPVVTITHAAGTFVVGETLTGATTGATGIVLTSSSGNATVALTSLSPYKIFTGTENLDDETGTGPFALATIALGTHLRIVDTGGYYEATGKKAGATQIELVGGWNNTDALTITTAAVYGKGQAADLLARIPKLERTSGNLTSGEWSMATNNVPTLGKTYIRYSFQIKKNASIHVSQNGAGADFTYTYVLWARTDAANQTAFNAAIAAL